MCRPTLDLLNVNTLEQSKDNGASQDIVNQRKGGGNKTDNISHTGMPQGVSNQILFVPPVTPLSKDHFVFAAAVAPEAKETWSLRSWVE